MIETVVDKNRINLSKSESDLLLPGVRALMTEHERMTPECWDAAFASYAPVVAARLRLPAQCPPAAL